MRVLVIGLLALGTVLGYGSAFMAMRYHGHYGDRHEAFEHHIAEICTDAALRSGARTPKPEPPAE